MAGPKMDGAGTVKMETLDVALDKLQKLHGIVERMAVEMRSNKPTQAYSMQLRRAGTPLVGLLKGQFGMISDQVAALLLLATRSGGGDQAKLRSMREGVAQIRTALEIAVTRTREAHTIDDAADETGDEKADEAAV